MREPQDFQSLEDALRLLRSKFQVLRRHFRKHNPCRTEANLLWTCGIGTDLQYTWRSLQTVCLVELSKIYLN